MRVAKKHCSGKIVSVLEGGYQMDKQVLKKCVHAHLRALLSDDDYVSPAAPPPAATDFVQFAEPLPPSHFPYPGMRAPHPSAHTTNITGGREVSNGSLSTNITKISKPSPSSSSSSSSTTISPIIVTPIVTPPPKPYNPITDSSSAPHASTSISKISNNSSSSSDNSNADDTITIIEDDSSSKNPPKKGSIEALLS